MKVTSRWLPAILGVMTAVGPLSTDMYLPAFPAIEAQFGLAQGTAQITLATWFAGLAIGQLAQGTLADRFGRRGPLMVGLLLYTAASVGCAVAPNLPVLAGLRFVAAFGGSASLVLPRAVVRDVADGHEAARLMSRLMLVMGAAPILAPTLGGALLSFATWHLIFWLAAAHGFVSLGLVVWFLPETLPPLRRVRLGPAAMLSRYSAILQERSFAVHMGIGALVMFALFAYLAGAPPVYEGGYGVSPPVSGMLYGVTAIGFIAGSQASPLLLHRFGLSAVLRWATRAAAAAALAMAALATAGGLGLLSVLLPALAFTACLGFIQPLATVGALSGHAAHAGSASALMGTVQFLLAAVSGSAVGFFTDGTARPMALLMLLGTGSAVLLDLSRGRVRAAPI